jgi:hypothetical protein
MTAETLLDELKARGIRIEPGVKGKLHLTPKTRVTPELVVAVREHKPALLARLQVVRNVTPDSRNPLLRPDVRAKIQAVEAEARAKGWPAELLWNAGFWDGPRGLAAVLDSEDEIGDITSDYIEILKTRRDLLRFRRQIG